MKIPTTKQRTERTFVVPSLLLTGPHAIPSVPAHTRAPHRCLVRCGRPLAAGGFGSILQIELDDQEYPRFDDGAQHHDEPAANDREFNGNAALLALPATIQPAR